MTSLRSPAVLRRALPRPSSSSSRLLSLASSSRRTLATHTAVPSPSHRIVVVGGGAAGQAISHQLIRAGQSDVALLDGAEYHHYQPGWTLVGGGLKQKQDLRKPMSELLQEPQIKHYARSVAKFDPENKTVELNDGLKVTYDHLVVCPGLELKWEKISGLQEALVEDSKAVSSIYSYDTCSNLYPSIEALRSGRAIFTQPAGIIKCAGAPQKVMWLAHDHWKQAGLRDASKPDVQVTFASGMPSMFSVPKYSEALDALRKERNVEGLLLHNLVGINGRKATFDAPEGKKVERTFDLLHVTPPQGPLAVIAESPLADAAGFVEVDQATLRHKRFETVWSAGDASSLPTSKTAAAITAQAPVLVANLLAALNNEQPPLTYDGYTSCPLLTEYGKVMLAEFVYGLKPQETFGKLLGIDQAVPRRAFYHLKKDFFPAVYYGSFVKGTWAGPKGFITGSPSAAASRSLHTSAAATFSQRRGFSSTAQSQRNLPSRRARDPLDDNPNAQRLPLNSGETLIVRNPPTQRSSETMLPESAEEQDASSAASLFLAAPTYSNLVARLPPALPTRTKKRTQPLTAEQITQIRTLRAQDPLANTAAALAKKFGCSALFVSMVAPAPKEVREMREQTLRDAKSSWGEKKRLTRMERKARKELW